MAGHEKMVCPSSKVKKGIVSILEREGFIANWQEVNTAGKRKGTVLNQSKSHFVMMKSTTQSFAD